jgi:hypothetical protein
MKKTIHYSAFLVLYLSLFVFNLSINAQNVGINTTTPLSTLDIKGRVGIGLNYAGLIAAPANGAIIEGNVGIGTSTPLDKLHVVGNTQLVGSLNATGNVRLGGTLGINAPILGSLGEGLSYSGFEMRTNDSDSSDLNLILFENSSFSPWINFGHARGTAIAPAVLQDNDAVMGIFGHGYNGTKFINGGGIELVTKGTPTATSLPTQMNFFTTPAGNTSYQTQMVINDVGNVGIGTTTPNEKLDVFGKIKGYALQITEGANNGYILKCDAEGNATWINPNTLGSLIETDPKMGNLTANYLPKWNSTTLANTQVFDNGTNVGIGTNTPTQAKLVVNGNQNNTLAAYGFLKNDGSIGTSASGNAQNYSIYASNRIAASEFNAFSDRRIKHILRGSNSEEDLATLMKLKITDYKLIDSIAKGNTIYKKVIAQEVAEVYPNAVSKMTDFIPNIYQLSSIKDGFIAIANPKLEVGDKVKLIFGDKQEVVKVWGINENGFYTEGVSDGSVFVFGKEVNDFHTVDYEALSTLNISATQALMKRINDLKVQNAALKTDVKEMKADIEQIKAAILKKGL